MKRSELKELLKPIVKECLEESMKEVIIESGLLLSVITEVVKGVAPLNEHKENKIVKNSEIDKEKLTQTRKKMLEEIVGPSYKGVNVFEGIQDTIPDEVAGSPANPMQGIAPHDSGVDISQLFDFNKAKILASKKKRK